MRCYNLIQTRGLSQYPRCRAANQDRGRLEIDVNAAADALNVAAGAGNHGIDVGGDVVEHDPRLRVEVPVDAQSQVLLTARTRPAGGRRQYGRAVDEVQVGVTRDELHRPATEEPVVVALVKEGVFHGDRSRPRPRFLV